MLLLEFLLPLSILFGLLLQKFLIFHKEHLFQQYALIWALDAIDSLVVLWKLSQPLSGHVHGDIGTFKIILIFCIELGCLVHRSYHHWIHHVIDAIFIILFQFLGFCFPELLSILLASAASYRLLILVRASTTALSCTGSGAWSTAWTASVSFGAVRKDGRSRLVLGCLGSIVG